MFFQLLGLIITLNVGSDLSFGIPAVDLIFVGQQASLFCVGLAYFHLVLFRQSSLLNFVNLVRKESLNINRSSQCTIVWKMRLLACFHFMVGISWVPIYFVTFFFRAGVVPAARDTWYRVTHDSQFDASKLDGNLGYWKLIIGFIIILIRVESITLATTTSVLIYFVARLEQTIVENLVADLKKLTMFCLVPSNVVSKFFNSIPYLDHFQCC